MIKFGTDGWRDIMADQFTFANVKNVTQGIAAHMNARNLGKRGVVVGYDNRFLSEEFAAAVASVFTGNGIKVFLPARPLPTPVTAFAVRALNAGGAVMITASHNPPTYNGLKFIPEYAGPALPDVTDDIEKEVARVFEGSRVYELPAAEAKKLGLIETVSVDDAYIKHLKSLVNLDKLADRRLKVAVDPMFGAGLGYLERILGEAGCTVTAIQNYRDPLFGGSMPEPTDAMLGGLKKTVAETQAELGLALDGDADRFGVVDDAGRYMSPNKVLSLLLWNLLASRTYRGPVVRTLATTHLLDRIAADAGLPVIETPVGFKYIGQAMREKGCLIGGEESGGMTVQGHIPEKDGILAGLLVAEAAARTGQGVAELYRGVEEQFGRAISERLDIHYENAERDAILTRIKDYRPTQVAGIAVDSISTLEGKKVLLKDGSWLLIRASGTEPLIRLYAETGDEAVKLAIQNDVRQALGI